MTKIPLVFLAGMGRSGSTLLERLLDGLPGWWSMGEVLQIWERGATANEKCGCGEAFLDCPVWTAVGEKAFGGWDAIEVDRVAALRRSVERDRYIPLLYRPTLNPAFNSRLKEYNRILSRLYQAVRETTGAKMLVDSGKHLSAALVLRQNPDLDLRVAHLIRDSRGVAYSFAKVVKRPAGGSDALMHRMSPLETSLRYLAYNSLLTFTFGEGRRVVRYEDMVEDPGGTVSEICAWATRAPCTDPTPASGSVDLATGHGISGNPMRERNGSTTLRVDDEWRARMPALRKALVTAITSPTLIQSRYRLWPSGPPSR